MLEDMRLRGLAPITQASYLRYAHQLAEFSQRSPAALGEQEVRAFLLHMMRERRVSASTQAVCVAGLRFLFGVTLRRGEMAALIPYPKIAFRLPDVLSGKEVARLLECIRSPKHRTLCCVMYATGLRVSEACKLVPGDVDSARGLLRVRQGKGSRDRDVPMGSRLLETLREYWRLTRPARPFLFPGEPPCKPISRVAVHKALRRAAGIARIRKHVSPHTLRHCFATHMLEMGVDLRVIQVLLGHRSIESTMRYLHVAREHLTTIKSPFDVLGTTEGEVLR
jgi:site-specific recombinase XerD